ncbi:YraN family protein [Acinetobacter guerrae]|uniref:YraN family protein n=1 Tax=Acinetobacter guerrae TaxID=1843371 RepID=UPI00125F542D|nr:YraN family protein [Acinetobacter guerrae]
MTMNHHHALGQWAEQQALRILQKQGFQLVKQNFHSRFGELDLIVERGNELIFVEVKARSMGSYGQASEMIRPSQQRKIIRTAEYFLICHPAYEQFYCRFDVICFDFPQKIAKTVQQDFSKLRYDQQWIENAFTL